MEFNFFDTALQMSRLMDPKQPSSDGDSAKLNHLAGLYLANLPQCMSVHVLQRVLELDDFYLPVDVVKATFERLLSLGCQNRDILERYATWLYLNGPDWDDLADQLMQRVQRMAGSKPE